MEQEISGHKAGRIYLAQNKPARHWTQVSRIAQTLHGVHQGHTVDNDLSPSLQCPCSAAESIRHPLREESRNKNLKT